MSISPDARISLLDTFVGASAGVDGVRGQVPAPVAGQQNYYLRGDGTWAAVTATSGGSGTVTYVDVSGGGTGLVFSGGPVTASGVITASGTLAATAGGTGRGSYTAGDLLYATASNSLSVVGIGASGQVLTASAGVPVWSSIPTSTGGSGSTVYNAQATVDFGFATGLEGDIATVTVSATWVVASSIITVSPYAVANADHDPEDYAVENITAYAANLASGVGFDIIAAAPRGSWGRYVVNAMGV